MIDTLMDTEASKRIVIYGAVAHVPPPERLPRRVRTYIKHAVLTWSDILRWRLLRKLDQLDYRSYVTPSVVNIGDVAIIKASCQTLSKAMGLFKFQFKFQYSNWEDRSNFYINENLKDESIIAVCGSGYITFDRDGRLAGRLRGDLNAMQSTEADVVFYGIGVNRLLTAGGVGAPVITDVDAEILRQLLHRAALISVRDFNSQKILSRYTDKPIRLISDPAFYLAEIDHKRDKNHLISNTGQVVIGINFPFHGPDATARVRESLPSYIAMLKKIQHQTKCKFVYMLHFEAARIIPRLLKNSGVSMDIIGGSPDTLIEGYRSLNIHIGGMLHSCILAASAGTPSVAIAYDVKHAGFFSLLGLERYCIPATPFDADRFVTAALSALAEEDELRATIRSARVRLEKEADAFAADCVKLMNKPKV